MSDAAPATPGDDSPPPAAAGAAPRTVGVLGSMVWDRIEHPDGEPVERWGGIAYSLAAASAALPAGWRVRPVLKVGSDLARTARAFLETVPGLELPGAVVEVPEPNNRVHLHYEDRHHRREVLTGGVPPWRPDELAPWLGGLDALFVNLISGFELDLATAGRLREWVDGPVYADLHSLLLDRRPHGVRQPRPLDRPDDWLAAFDMVQANERELALVAGERDPDDVVQGAVVHGLAAVFATHGPEGATWYGADDGPAPWTRSGASRSGAGSGGARVELRSVRVALEGPQRTGDPTGCGDVWGATCFMTLLAGEAPATAMRAANRAASRNVDHRGAEGLHAHLGMGQ